MFKWLSSFLFLRVFGWKIEGRYPNEIKKIMIIVVPHTSNWDFPIGLFLRPIWGADIKWCGKKSLFRFPMGIFARWLGGIPIDRSKRTNFVDAVVDEYNKSENLLIQIAPEGTRKKVDRLKTGFYHIAMGAKIPILMIKFDYGNKKVVVREPFYPSGDIEKDMEIINKYFKGTIGKIPEWSYM